MLRLVSVSLFAGAVLAVTPVAAQDQPAAQPQPQQTAPQPAQPAPVPPAQPQPAAPQPDQAQPAPAPQVQPLQAEPQQAPPSPAAPQQQAQPEMAPPDASSMGNQFCNKDIQPMLMRREELAKTLQAINKRGRPKTFDQAKKIFNDFCGTLSTYISNDQKLLDYMGKNKDFCAINDQNLQQISLDLKQVQSTRTRICSHPPKQQAAPAPGGPGGGGGQAVPKPPVDLKLQ